MPLARFEGSKKMELAHGNQSGQVGKAQVTRQAGIDILKYGRHPPVGPRVICSHYAHYCRDGGENRFLEGKLRFR